MEHTKHLWRAAILLGIILTAVVVGRHFLVPDSFGEMGYFRGSALDEFLVKPPEHGGTAACAECHDDIADAKASGGHASVQCEVCHAPLTTHVVDDEKVADMDIDRSYTLCAYCHRRLIARPPDIPQIDLHQHLELAPGAIIPAEACLDCHDTDGIHSP